MSGSGSSGGNGGNGPPEQPDDCLRIFETTILNSPVPERLAQLSPGETLEIVAESETGPLVAVNQSGDPVGSITSGSMPTILRCIAEGYTYIAVIQSIDDGRCEVQIRPESS